MRHECWTSQASPSCSPWQSVCHNWTATVATHSCVSGCESILAVTASQLICVWIFEMKLFDLLQRCLVERAGPIAWPGRSCDFTLVYIFWSNVTEHIYMFHHLPFSCWKDTEIEQFLRPVIFWDCAQHKVEIPFHRFRITNLSHLQVSRCPNRTCLGSIQPAHTGCVLEELTVTELM